jgi:hypothetical protein
MIVPDPAAPVDWLARWRWPRAELGSSFVRARCNEHGNRPGPAAVPAETPRARSLALELPQWPGQRPGQHVDVRLTADDGDQAQRSYSIASAPDEDRLVLTVERLDDGEVSRIWSTSCAPATSWTCGVRSAATSSGMSRSAALSSGLPAGPIRSTNPYRAAPDARRV